MDQRALDLGRRVNTMVQNRFQGNYRQAFNHYAQGGAEVSGNQVGRMLGDAGVGNLLTRGAYKDAVMDRFDTNRNGGVSWSEFQSGMRQVGVNVGQ
ncbi:MAG: EF-hand domain-containing protein [Myxococcaceae bacterium]|nr:EF-hand domain-containing protein [Myxococcaceae bacterium]